jgi:hypothetical protein
MFKLGKKSEELKAAEQEVWDLLKQKLPKEVDPWDRVTFTYGAKALDMYRQESVFVKLVQGKY